MSNSLNSPVGLYFEDRMFATATSNVKGRSVFEKSDTITLLCSETVISCGWLGMFSNELWRLSPDPPREIVFKDAPLGD
jgi:hypothetical protein